jgi:GNAT superfamily N-acetyltransferase
MNIKVEIADYRDEKQAQDIGYLLNYYATDPMGGGKALDEYIINNLADELSQIPHAFSVLCYVDEHPAALANCFEGFSTFKCKPLVNIHDVVVVKEYRGLGISLKMLAEIERIAKQRNCCKLTLEVLEGNTPAAQAYIKFGFTGYELDPTHGKAMFWQKPLN